MSRVFSWLINYSSQRTNYISGNLRTINESHVFSWLIYYNYSSHVTNYILHMHRNRGRGREWFKNCNFME